MSAEYSQRLRDLQPHPVPRDRQPDSLTSPASATLDVRFSTNAQGEAQIASVKMAA